MKLDKELQKVKDQQAADYNTDPVKDVKLLMEGDRSEDLRILTNLGWTSNLARAQHHRGVQLELENLDNKYQGGIFTETQIKELAVRYRLRFLNSTHFKGDLDLEIAAKIKEFARINGGAVMDNHSLQKLYFILAPPEAFTLTKSEKPPKKSDEDPVLFFLTPEGQYKMIHKWGKDFTMWRRLVGFRWEDANNYYASNYVIVLSLLLLCFSFLFPLVFIEHIFGSFAICAGVSFVIALICSGRKIKWESNENYKDHFWTANNWRSDKVNT